MKTIKLFLLVTFLIAEFVPASALIPRIRENYLFLGMTLGHDNIIHNRPVMQNTIIDQAVMPDNITGSGYNIGISYELFIGDFRKTNQSLIFDLKYQSSVTYKTFLVDNKTLQIGGEDITMPRNLSVKYNMDRIRLDAKYKFIPYRPVPFDLICGLVFSKGLSMKARETTHDPYVMTDEQGNGAPGYMDLVVYDDEIRDAAPLDIGLTFEIGYEVNIQNIIPGMYLRPLLSYYYALTPVQSDQDWDQNSWGFGLSFIYAFWY